MKNIIFSNNTTSTTYSRYYNYYSKKQSIMREILLVIVGVLLLSHNGKTLSSSSDFEKSQPCLDETCIHLASNILDAIDASVDPCEDFYAYACNGWIKKNPIPDGKNYWNTFPLVQQKNYLIIKNVLDQSTEILNSEAEQKAKLFYESCLDENENIETLGAKPLLALLDNVGGWNVTHKDFIITHWNLQNTLEIIQNKYGINALFSYMVEADDKNSNRHIIHVDQGGLSLPSEQHYLNKSEYGKLIEAYLDWKTKIGILLGGSPTDTKSQMEAVLMFETKLANITMPADLRRDSELLYNLMTIEELQAIAGFIDWMGFLENAFKAVGKEIIPEEEIVVNVPEYLSKLSLLVEEYNATEDGRITLSNYLNWKVVGGYAGHLSKEFRDANRRFRKALFGSEGEEKHQWKACIADTDMSFGLATGAIFVREAFPADSKIKAEEMINDITQAFKKNFENLEWMDLETRKAAEIKADAVLNMIGYPDLIQNSQLLDDHYSQLNVKNDTYFENQVNISYYFLVKNLEKINEPVNKSQSLLDMPPATVNAQYDPAKNLMTIPAGILQNSFYDSKFPPSINFGGIGAVIGHELTHGFDDQGRKYDKDGNLRQWWNNKTIELYKDRTDCVVKQYGEYQVNGKNINGNLTLGENIADNGGVKAAYKAYLEYTKDKVEHTLLPGIDLTHRQLFFLAFAQVWCAAQTVESADLRIAKDPHSSARYRVIGTLTNSNEFSEEFKCPVGSKMNPLDKCEVW